MLEQLLKYYSPSSLCIALVALFTLYQIFKYVNEFRKLRALGSRPRSRPAWLPLGLNIVYEAVTKALQNRNLEVWRKNFLKYGNPANPWNLELYIGGQRVILTADPENIKAVLATQFHDFGKGETFNKEWHDFLGDSIFTTDGRKWQDSRHLIRPQFIKDRVSDLHTFEKHYQVLQRYLGGHGVEVDVADLFFRFSMDTSMDFLMGSSINSLENPESKFAEAFGVAQKLQSIIARMGPLNILMPRKAFFRHIKTIDNFINPIIDRTLRLSPQELEKNYKSDEGYTFLHALAGYTRDRTILRDQIIAVLLAGRDTTACSLSWCFYELSTHPQAVYRLRQEILETVGKDRVPTYDDLKNMKYLQHVLNETLRLYPVVPFNVRVALKDTTLPRGGGPDASQPIAVLKNTPIGYSTLLMQRREDVYPPQSSGFPPVEEFVPERWDGWTPKSWTYIPFNGGPRICVGQQFALTEMGYVVTRIFQRFSRVEYRMGDAKPILQSDIVLQPKDGVKVAFYEDEQKV